MTSPRRRNCLPLRYAEIDKLKKNKNKIDDKNLNETLNETKKVCLSIFLIYYKQLFAAYKFELSLCFEVKVSFHFVWINAEVQDTGASSQSFSEVNFRAPLIDH